MTAALQPAPGGLPAAARVLAGETGKGLALLWARRATLVMATVTIGLTYLAVEFFLGGRHLDHAILTVTLPGLFAYAVAATAAVQGSGGIAEELSGGTLEQSQLSPARPSLLAAGRVTALAAEGLIPAVVLTTVFWAGFGLHYPGPPDALVPLLLTWSARSPTAC